jgi:hypothetical protein
VKASDISDIEMLQLIRQEQIEKKAERPVWADEPVETVWTCTWTLAAKLAPTYPEKVVAAKLRKLLKKKMIDGCPCGCRGDWTVLPKGEEILREASV